MTSLISAKMFHKCGVGVRLEQNLSGVAHFIEKLGEGTNLLSFPSKIGCQNNQPKTGLMFY